MPKQKLETIYVSSEVHRRVKDRAKEHKRKIGSEVAEMLDELDKIAAMNVPVLVEKKSPEKMPK